MNVKKTALATIAVLVVVGGVVSGVALGASGTKHGHQAGLNIKATTTTGSFKSNEDPAHEAGESAAREAQENSGQGPGPGGGTFKPNEDPAHEAGESAAREAQEDAGQRPTGP